MGDNAYLEALVAALDSQLRQKDAMIEKLEGEVQYLSGVLDAIVEMAAMAVTGEDTPATDEEIYGNPDYYDTVDYSEGN